jgi:uncharacterized hydrophobic protein (TIGR00271 family)
MNNPIAIGRDSIRQGAGFDRAFIFSNLAATVIACAGLLGDSAATIIGAMLVATLMAPIMGIALALVDFDNRLLRQSLITLASGALLVLIAGTLLGSVAPDAGPTQEMLSRTAPRLLDLVVALASGAIGAYALASPRLSATIVGVSIAVALVPPLATAGIFVARAQWGLAQGAFLLAFVNIVAIQVGASVALWLCGYRGEARPESASVASALRRGVMSLLLMIGLMATLAVHAVHLIAQQSYEASTRQAILAALAQRPEARLNEVSFTAQDGAAVVTAVVRSPARFTRDDVATIGARLPLAPDGSTPQLRLRQVEVDVVVGGD